MTDWLDEGRSGAAVDVAAVMDSKAGELAWRVVAAGALLSFSTTSDGGALGITVTVDGRYRREYFRDAEEATDWLEGAATYAESMDLRESASAAAGRRPRRRKPA